ncbi:unnamed protein product, partial [Nesidiocoris tenuis]
SQLQQLEKIQKASAIESIVGIPYKRSVSMHNFHKCVDEFHDSNHSDYSSDGEYDDFKCRTDLKVSFCCCRRAGKSVHDLRVQLDVFDEQKESDEAQSGHAPAGVDLNSHLDVFNAILLRAYCHHLQQRPRPHRYLRLHRPHRHRLRYFWPELLHHRRPLQPQWWDRRRRHCGPRRRQPSPHRAPSRRSRPIPNCCPSKKRQRRGPK